PDGSPGRPEAFTRGSFPRSQHYLAVRPSSEDGVDYAESSHYEDAEETLDDLEEELQKGAANGLGIHAGNVTEEDDLEDVSTSGDTEYFDPETAQPVVAERHEDRADAFDYENFFLHSAMGTYSRERRDS